MDIELMRRLSPRVNVIPVIGKADSLTPSELKGFKKRVCDYTACRSGLVSIGL
jgi:cell division control protein 11